MSSPTMLAFIRCVLGLLATFWIVAGALVITGVATLGSTEGAVFLGILMLGNGAALGLAGAFSLRGKTLVDVGALALLAANAVLSVTDQIGALDLVSFGLSSAALVLVGLAMRSRRDGT